MAYQAQEWTVNALSVELKMDRRTVAKRLERIRPVRTEGIAKYYLLADAAPALFNSAPKLVTEDGEAVDFNTERTRLTKEQADKLERERLLDERRLVPAEDVHRLIEQLVGGANARLGAMPAKLASIVSPEDPAGARRHLELGIEEVRAELRRLETDEPRDADAA
jgi:hypothetical protein